jgi:hypothetical protein
MAAFLVRALGLTDAGANDQFVDDDDSIFEDDIEKIAAAGITRGCNPPVNDAYCPDTAVTRGQMAAFLVRALGLTDAGPGNLFMDDGHSVFEADIDRLGTAGITRGCNPPVNDRYCPEDPVTRAQMAAFLARAFDLGAIPPPAAIIVGSGSIDEFELGDPVDDVVDALTTALGPPTHDELQLAPTNPLPYGWYAEDYFRLVLWNRPGLYLVFSDASIYRSDDTPHLISINVGDPNDGAIITTDEGIRVGSNYTELVAAYGATLSVYEELECEVGWFFIVAGESGWQLTGDLSGDPSLGGQTVTGIRTGSAASC